MKKLMIAAAAVAMIASVEAAVLDSVVYQATYNLKTTIGKSADDSNTYKLGKNALGQFWYQHASVNGAGKYWTVDSLAPLKITLIDKTNFKLVKKAGNYVPDLTAAGKKNDAVLATLVALEALYPDKSANQWCLTFKYTQTVCYRVAGTIKVDGYFEDSECLDQDGSGILPTILDNFGGATFEKSKKVELYSEKLVSAGACYDPNNLSDKNWDLVEVKDNAKYPSTRYITELSIAGHGTYGKVFDQTDGTRDGMTQVSGYAVGTADMPTCETCCAPGTPLDVIWDCCAVGAVDTAVFGTFTFKYNAAMTKKLY